MSHPFDQMGDVREWAPPGWHWEVSPIGAHNLVRNLGPVVDPDLLWWRSRGPGAVRREAAPEEVVRRHIREEDEHVRRYLYLLDRSPDRVGRFFRDLTLAMIPLAFHIFGLLPSVAQHQVDIDYS
jgi:hypothetical protein